MFNVNFYQEENGKKPVAEFIRTLNVKMRAKVTSDLNRLEMLGNEAREPLSKYLEENILELRSTFGGDIVRILYFFDENKIIIATNGFIKKQQNTPRSEIALAEQRRMIYFARKENKT